MKRLAYVVITAATATTLACGGGSNSTSNGSGGGTEMSDNSGGGNMADQARTGSGASSAGAQETLTGCVLAGGDAGSYVLQLASTADSRSGSSSGGSSSSPSSSSAGKWAPGQTFRLVTQNGEDIGQHLNKQVAVNGYVENSSSGQAIGTSGSQSSASGSGANSAGQGANSAGMRTTTSGDDMQSIRAQSIRKVADRCQ